MTRYERLKKMSVEELAMYIDSKIESCEGCWLPSCLAGNIEMTKKCERAWLDYLNEEVGE